MATTAGGVWFCGEVEVNAQQASVGEVFTPILAFPHQGGREGRYANGKATKIFGGRKGGKEKLLVRSGFHSERLQLCHPFIEPRTLRADDLEANFCGDVDAVDNLLIIGHQLKDSLTGHGMVAVVNVFGRVEIPADFSEVLGDACASRIGGPNASAFTSENKRPSNSCLWM